MDRCENTVEALITYTPKSHIPQQLIELFNPEILRVISWPVVSVPLNSHTHKFKCETRRPLPRVWVVRASTVVKMTFSDVMSWTHGCQERRYRRGRHDLPSNYASSVEIAREEPYTIPIRYVDQLGSAALGEYRNRVVG